MSNDHAPIARGPRGKGPATKKKKAARRDAVERRRRDEARRVAKRNRP